MNKNTKIIIGVIVVILIIAGIYGISKSRAALKAEEAQTALENQQKANGKVAASSEADGAYYVQIKSVNQSPEDATLTMQHVTYFEGEEARASAIKEVACEGKNIEVCVPTLIEEYYVRVSGSPEFFAPLNVSTKIEFSNRDNATPAQLSERISAIPNAVFIVTIKDGNITTVEEVTSRGVKG